jgi:hypothetical protein
METYIFAAPTLPQRREWVRVLRTLAEAAVAVGGGAGEGVGAGAAAAGGATPTPGVGGAVAAKAQAAAEATAAAAALAPARAAALRLRLEVAAATPADVSLALALARLRNGACVDCGAPGPDWSSLTSGGIFCLACSGVHRALGVRISKVRSLILDEWDSPAAAVLLGIGNGVVRRV